MSHRVFVSVFEWQQEEVEQCSRFLLPKSIKAERPFVNCQLVSLCPGINPSQNIKKKKSKRWTSVPVREGEKFCACGWGWWFFFDLKGSLGFDARVSFGCGTERDSHLILV